MSAPDATLLDLLDEVGVRRAEVGDLLAHTRQLIADQVAEAIEEPIPVVEFDDLGRLPDAARAAIARRACVVVRNTFDRDQAEAWNEEIGDYLARNSFERHFAERYPDDAAGGSRIWGIYWSRPQVLARQHERMAAVRRFLNGFWSHRSPGAVWFDPDHDISYADRLRRRAPGVTARGLAPHSDAPSAGGWRVPENIAVFRQALVGHPERVDPWDAAHRTSASTEGTVFRTFQGWTALSEMRPADGVLHVAAVPLVGAYILVAGIAGELGVAADPQPAPRRSAADELVRSALKPIPAVVPGDTVWWHGDLIHSVGPAANDRRWGNVMYIGAAPRCPRNDRYVGATLERFERGASPPDFPTEDFEVDFVGRAGVGDLGPLGRQQFGLAPLS